MYSTISLKLLSQNQAFRYLTNIFRNKGSQKRSICYLPVALATTSNWIKKEVSISIMVGQNRSIHSTIEKEYSFNDNTDTLIKYKYKRPKQSSLKNEKVLVPIDMNELVTEVIQKVSSVDKMVMSIPKSSIRRNIELVHDLGVSKSDILHFFCRKPSVLKTEQLEFLIQGLKSYGFKGPNIFKLFNTTDNLQEVDLSRIESSFEWLRSQGMVEKDIIQTFQRDPNITNLSFKQISMRVKNLKALFKSEDVMRLIVTTPTILYDDMSHLTEKFMYVHHTMGVSQRQIMYTSMFQYTLQHTVNRHIFLERAGFFVKDTKRQAGITSTNPMLQDIIDSTDTEFAHKFGKMSLEEYQTFCKLLKNEVKEVQDNDDDI